MGCCSSKDKSSKSPAAAVAPAVRRSSSAAAEKGRSSSSKSNDTYAALYAIEASAPVHTAAPESKVAAAGAQEKEKVTEKPSEELNRAIGAAERKTTVGSAGHVRGPQAVTAMVVPTPEGKDQADGIPAAAGGPGGVRRGSRVSAGEAAPKMTTIGEEDEEGEAGEGAPAAPARPALGQTLSLPAAGKSRKFSQIQPGDPNAPNAVRVGLKLTVIPTADHAKSSDDDDEAAEPPQRPHALLAPTKSLPSSRKFSQIAPGAVDDPGAVKVGGGKFVMIPTGGSEITAAVIQE